jgi:hypothetical protein
MDAWMQELSDDLHGMFTEGVHHSRWELIKTYHSVGKRILSDDNFVKHAKGNATILDTVSNNSGIHKRDLYRSIKFYDKFPDLDLLPDGKNISWHKIVEKYLPETLSEKKERLITCPGCGLEFNPKDTE